MLPRAIIGEGVEAVAGQVAEFGKADCGVYQRQPTHRALLDICGQFAAAIAIPDAFGFRVGERADH